MQGSANLNVMIQAARKASRSLIKDFREVESLQSSLKPPADFVLRAERAAGETLREVLMGTRPNYGWLAEGAAEVEGKDPTRRWIVDPLDASTNFLHGFAHWSITIALEFKGQIVSAVVFDASKDEMFVAEKGQGAWMNETRMRVSGRVRLNEALLGTGVPHGAMRTLPATIHDQGRLMPMVAGLRCSGSSALDLAYVAAGRLDGCWERERQPWNIAAGLLLVREAGGFAEALRKDGSIFDTGAMVAGAPGVFDKVASTLRDRS